ncbi:MAG TPA: hypothetical protein VK563_14735 [Puia sp.]|nr:hypothetical protein [Puia sp.]
MSNERPGDASHWINKLEGPDPSAAEPWAGKNAAWEKLYSRLHEKPRRRIPFWYWMAAASLLLILYMPVKQAIMGDRAATKEARIAGAGNGLNPKGKAGEPVKQTKGLAAPEKRTNERELTFGTQASVVEKRPTAAVQGRIKSVKSSAREDASSAREDASSATKDASTAKIEVTGTVLQPEPEQVNAKQMNVKESQPVEETKTVAGVIVPPVRKKLRVVHINELSDAGEQNNVAMDPGGHSGNQGIVAWTNTPIIQRPAGNNRIFTGSTKKHFLHFGRPRDQVDPYSTASTDNTPSELIKIKLSPQN